MTATDPTIAAVIVAAGRGTRAGGDVPKQWQMLCGTPIAQRSLRAFADHPRVDHVVLVLHPEDIAAGHWTGSEEVVIGGDTRAASVLAGLEALEGRFDLVLIHDAARPCVSAEIIGDVIDALQTAAGAAPGLPVTDALWRADGTTVTGTQSRDGLYAAQTPQGFHLRSILAAHRAYAGLPADDVEIARAAGMRVAITPASADNLKITRAEDFARAARILEAQMDIRTGNGFDVHAFGPGDHVMLCGVKISHDQGLVGHSDADVAMHAVTDAIFGALAKGDIGQHFPPSDPQWKGAQSHVFLRHAVKLAEADGFAITHVDCTLICETPKVGPHAVQMREALAGILEIDTDRVSVKATTSERLGFTGRGEGIACIATATLVKS